MSVVPGAGTVDSVMNPVRQPAAEEHAADSTERPAVRVLLASDDPFSREAFKAAVTAPEVELVAATTVRVAAEHTAAELAPDVIVLDAQMPALEALEALGRMRSELPDARILVFSAPEGEEFGLLCLSIGASGYLSKEVNLATMPRILERLGHGEAVFSRRLGTRLLERLREREHRSGTVMRRAISAPERQLLELLKSGRDVEEAAAQLGVSTATVRRHVASARRKLTADDFATEAER